MPNGFFQEAGMPELRALVAQDSRAVKVFWFYV
jgi:hypothetical protein